jgi:dihydroorotate dehydrogenase
MYSTLRPLIYRLTPEQAHKGTIAMLRLAGGLAAGRLAMRLLFTPRQNGPAVQAFGLTFPNPLGMAAGYDKDALGWRGLSLLGFGHIEVGTVTPRPQPGNSQPRIFRLVEDHAVINRMGFPNQGAQVIARRLQGGWRPSGTVLGVNIGKNKATPLEEAGQDYLSLLHTFAPLCDYLAINVSSPNTPGLRSLQTRQALEDLLAPLAAERDALAKSTGRRVPLLVKLAPDLTLDELDGALEAILNTAMDGLIASNTTLSRDGLTSAMASETGGMSGAPLKTKNTLFIREVVRRLGESARGRLPVVASGGVMTCADVQEKLDAGAVLVQLYTGLIYAGPGLVKKMLEEANHA